MAHLAQKSDSPTLQFHRPVMAEQVAQLLAAGGPRLAIDVTVGTGGHAQALLDATQARLLGVDRDERALAVARQRLEHFGARVKLVHCQFSELAKVAAEEGFAPADAVIADLGLSSLALDDAARGFSLRLEGPLDMRMDQAQRLSAYDLVNEEGEAELARILREYGEERAARRIARLIVAARRRRPIETTTELRALVERVLGGRRRPGGIHPATRTFQALRIAVNDELGELDRLLADAPAMLSEGGRMVVISYHSLEDRRVKQRFRALAAAGGFALVTAKALRPGVAEVAANPRARSARLRCLERGRR